MVVLSVGRAGWRVASSSRRAFRAGARTRGIARVHAGVLLFAKRSAETRPAGRAGTEVGDRSCRSRGAGSARNMRSEVARLDVENAHLERARARVATAARAEERVDDGGLAFFSRPVVREGEGSLRELGEIVRRRPRRASASAPRENRTVNTAGKTNSRVSAVVVGRVARARAPGRSPRVVAFALRFADSKLTPVDGARATRATAAARSRRGESARGDAPRVTNARGARSFATRPSRARRRRSMESEPARSRQALNTSCVSPSQHELDDARQRVTPLRHSRGKVVPHLYGQTVRASTG